MTDCFALLNEPPRPWLDPDALKRKFLAVSAEVHPDRVHTAGDAEKQAAQRRYTELNGAYNCLREPKERLRHLLELECGAKPAELQQIPPDLMDLFLQVSGLCRDADEFLEEKQKVSSPLLKVKMFERGQAVTEKLAALRQTVQGKVDALLAELKQIDARWEAERRPESPRRAATLARLEELYRLFSYYARWTGQLHERIALISF